MSATILQGNDAVSFITTTRHPIAVVKAGGAPLQTNAEYVESRLAQMYPDSAQRAIMRPWGQRWLPVLDNDDAHVEMVNYDGMRTNALLDKREWAELDREIFRMVRLRRNAVQDLIDAGLTKQTTLATMVSQWRMSSERARPSVNMDGRSRVDRDRTDRMTFSVPVPIIRTDYEIGKRELDASRRLGSPLDTHEASEAAESVAEEAERMLFDGNSEIVVGGDGIAGYTSFAARLTDTATNYGGGDFGTEGNGIGATLGMLGALAAVRYHGPFVGYVAQVQYHELLNTHSDGSGQTELDRIKALPQIKDVKASDMMTAGEYVLVQMTPNVVDLLIALDIENREWASGDGQALFYAVMSSMVPRLKQDVDGNTGICHATGC